MLVRFLYIIQLPALKFNTDVSVSWGEWHIEISKDGEEMKLQMDQSSGSGSETDADF
jgi:hypothetical protein